MKERKFKPCLTKQLLNVFKLRCEWLSLNFNKKVLNYFTEIFLKVGQTLLAFYTAAPFPQEKLRCFSGGEVVIVRRLRISKIS